MTVLHTNHLVDWDKALSRCGERRNIKILKTMEGGAKKRPMQLKNVLYRSALT